MTFDELLAGAEASGGLAPEDLVAAMAPVMRTIASWHEQGLVAPLRGIAALDVDDRGVLVITAPPSPPLRNRRRVDQVGGARSSAAFEVVGERRTVTDLDAGTERDESLEVVERGEPIEAPAFVVGYETWEHQLDHHDELTDVASLGLLLASLALGLDLRERSDVEELARDRANLFRLRPSLHPVIARLVSEMVELDRHRRAQDLPSLAERLETYRDQPIDFDLERVGVPGGTPRDRRRAIQSALRDRLFEINRRNRLIYFKPTQQSVNLTLGSVPLLLDVRNLTPDHVATWSPGLADQVLSGKAVSLSSILRFEDSPYLPGILDKVIAEARRHRNEYGMAQLRLVVCFLRWHNLKEVKEERIDSPLLLLPIELTRKRGVRDSYVLKATSTVAEVNPALRHHLRQLYDLDLPESVDLATESVDDLHQRLEAQIQASEPGVILTKVDRPRLEIIHRRAQLRVDQYRKRQRAARNRTVTPRSHSYDARDRRPLGIALFDAYVRYRTPDRLRTVAGAPPAPRTVRAVPAAVGSERQTYALQDGPANPYRWELDLCSLTVANFNHRKMTLVRDYAQLIEGELPNDAFDRLFGLDARPTEVAVAPELDRADRHQVVAADETQRAAIARARLGRSFIIQGPPGTGKSQTITNLIADHVGRGLRVLFVCEKRAALDVVHARLRAKGLDELCALIHDSQADKRDFVRGMKATYERWLAAPDDAPRVAAERTALIDRIEGHLRAIARFEEAMAAVPDGSPVEVRALIDRLVALGPTAEGEEPPPASVEVPTVAEWDAAASRVRRAAANLERLGAAPVVAAHPVAGVAPAVLAVDRPVEVLAARSSTALDALDALERALDPLVSGLALDRSDLVELQAVAAAVDALHPAARSALVPGSEWAMGLADAEARLAAAEAAAGAAHERTARWTEPLSREEVAAAIPLAQAKETSSLRFLDGAWRRLKKAVAARYDGSGLAVRPAVTQLLADLAERYTADDEAAEARTAGAAFGPGDLVATAAAVGDAHDVSGALAVSLRDRIAATAGATGPAADAELVVPLGAVAGQAPAVLGALDDLLVPGPGGLAERREEARRLLGAAGSLHELLADLQVLADEHPAVAAVVRVAPLAPDGLERWILRVALERFGARNADVERFSGLALRDHLEVLAAASEDLHDVNARAIRASVRARMLGNVALTNTPAAQLDPAGKEAKKRYAAGRREVEREFAKSMRYRSIRDLAGGPSGEVVMDLRPIWLMSPLSVSDTLPLDPDAFDVVIFDEASQIPLEDAVPALYRSHQAVVVGDQMQLPPTQFFSTSTGDELEIEVEDPNDDSDGRRVGITLDGDSFLSQAASTLPSTMLAWHYRSRSEDLIAYSNVAFYGGALATVPDRHRPVGGQGPVATEALDGDGAAAALLERNISFHLLPDGVYERRRNPTEAAYVADLVRSLLARGDGSTIGIAAFSEAQQGEIEAALERLAGEDPEFAARLESEERREDDGQFVGLFVKNLENIQGDERDIIVMSVCYGPGPDGRMLMGFGPINQRGGEKRLNVIFSRARRHMAIVSSIRADRITNVHNDGANALRRFLDYAEAVSAGDGERADAALAAIDPVRGAQRHDVRPSATALGLAAALEDLGYAVELDHGRSRFRCDLAVRRADRLHHQVAVLGDTAARAALAPVEERAITHPAVLGGFGWTVVEVLSRDWLRQPEAVIRSVVDAVVRAETSSVPPIGAAVADEPGSQADDPIDPPPTASDDTPPSGGSEAEPPPEGRS
ncbi:MAG: AAA domain-containing protein [Aquihabitans sp.]